MARRLTQRGKERRRQLLDFATERFAANGYHPTSVAEIVEGLGVGKGVFYWYFDSKEELFAEILKEAQADLRRRQQEAIESVDDAVSRIEIGIRTSMEWAADNEDLFTLFRFAISEEEFAPALRAGADVAVSDAVRHLEDAIANGDVRDADPDMLAYAILGVNIHLASVFIHERGVAPADVADLAVSFCLEGILGR